MDIISYLVELLQLRKEVGIIDLGTFYKKKSPGRYDKDKQSFLPPTYTLQFTSELKEEEELVNFISAKRNISPESATYYVSQFVEEVKEKLAVENEAKLNNLGRLYFTEHDGLSFEPVENTNYGSEFFGLPSLPEPINEADKDEVFKPDEEVYEEIAEAPTSPSETEEPKEKPAHPIIENIELDEVRDDLKHTMGHSAPAEDDIISAPEFIKEQHKEHPNRFGHTPESESENIDEPQIKEEIISAPEFIKAQHEEHPNRFGHTPESESENIDEPQINEEIISAPEFIKEQHEEHPNRFGHTPESEILANQINQDLADGTNATQEKKYLHLEDTAGVSQPIIEAPEFIKEQHAEHPNRFGNDPMDDEPLEERKSLWPKIIIGIVILAVIGAAVYYLKPEWFNQQSKQDTKPIAVVDSQQVTIDTVKAKQDSIAKTDSVLKANQVGAMKNDTTENSSLAPIKTNKPVETATSMFHVIAASFKTEAKAQIYIDKMIKLGYDAKIAQIEGSWKKVSIASFKTQQEAVKQRDILQKKLKGKDFLVKEIKNNTQP